MTKEKNDGIMKIRRHRKICYVKFRALYLCAYPERCKSLAVSRQEQRFEFTYHIRHDSLPCAPAGSSVGIFVPFGKSIYRRYFFMENHMPEWWKGKNEKADDTPKPETKDRKEKNMMRAEDIRSAEEIIGYSFRNPELLVQAFTRKSYAKENGGEDNEVLEFIGDKVLDLLIVKGLIGRFGRFVETVTGRSAFHSDRTEGQLTELKKRMVEKKTLAARMRETGLADALNLGKGDILKGIAGEDSVMEDLFEAIVGAVTLDCEWDLEKVCTVIERMLRPAEFFADEESENYVALIQEWSMKKYGVLPDEKIVPAEPVDGETEAKYLCFLTLRGVNGVFSGYARSKAAARRAACRGAYEDLKKRDLLWSLRDEIPEPSEECAIGQLETLARRGYFPLPSYQATQSYEENGNPHWWCECRIEGFRMACSAESSSKKEAKKRAAYAMLCYILGRNTSNDGQKS